jgi:hypothetical protein
MVIVFSFLVVIDQINIVDIAFLESEDDAPGLPFLE